MPRLRAGRSTSARGAEETSEAVGDRLHREDRRRAAPRDSAPSSSRRRRHRVQRTALAQDAPRSASASPKPRLTPCPASGWTPCAASPTSATRCATIAGQLRRCEREPGAVRRSTRSAPSACRACVCDARRQRFRRRARELLRQRSGADHTIDTRRPGRGQPREDAAVVAEPLEGAAAVRTLAGEIRDDRRLRVRLARRAMPAARRAPASAAPSAPTTRRADIVVPSAPTSAPASGRQRQRLERRRRVNRHAGFAQQRNERATQSRSSTIHASARSPSSYAEKLRQRAGIARRRASRSTGAMRSARQRLPGAEATAGTRRCPG